MAAALQRSSVSFRRQGSSGHVWDNLQIEPRRNGAFSGPFSGPLVHTPTRLSQDPISTPKSVQELHRRSIDSARDDHEKFQGNEMKDEVDNDKRQSCGLSSFFRGCIGHRRA
ncbi:hypothetical protein Tsubulata_048811 [Turnera subulata]|uniref:Uncharacterized protein n=1 Tax=Turnera subulata TaxID=218843 RepID=A0A9Q0JFH6_9ROSI|nr:hypothetical protein Tsubulata_048811 [Turnera subulata]